MCLLTLWIQDFIESSWLRKFDLLFFHSGLCAMSFCFRIIRVLVYETCRVAKYGLPEDKEGKELDQPSYVLAGAGRQYNGGTCTRK